MKLVDILASLSMTLFLLITCIHLRMCGVANQWLPLKLESEEVQSLLPLIDAVGFFELAENQVESELVDKDKGISLTCNPCAESQLEIKLGDKSNKVFWDCRCASKNITA